MPHLPRPSRLDDPATYEIVVQGRLDSSWAQWFEGIDSIVTRDSVSGPVTVLRGTLTDQVALHGMLARIRDLCLPLLQVEYLGCPDSTAPAPDSED